MRLTIYLLLILCFTSFILFAQAPITQWQRCLGGSSDDDIRSVEQASDGSYFVAGKTESNDGDIKDLHKSSLPHPYDAWVAKLDKNGTLLWQHCLGGSGGDFGRYLKATPDGGCIMVGSTGSADGDVVGQHGTGDGWAVKLNKNGDIDWQRCLGGVGIEGIYAVDIGSDGGYILAGSANNDGGDVQGIHGNLLNSDAWIIKLNDKGEIKWQRCLGGKDSEYAYSIHVTSDGGYIMGGIASSTDGDVSGVHGSQDAWVVKLDVNGKIQWQRCFGGTDLDGAVSVHPTSDKGYIMAGNTISKNGDVKGPHGGTDAWVVKMDSIGTLQWQRCLGGTKVDEAYSAQMTPTGGFIITASTTSDDDDVKGRHGGFFYPDAWLIKLDNAGATQWQRCLGGTGSDVGTAIGLTNDGGYIMAAYTNSTDFDVSGQHGGNADGWLVKLAPEAITCMQVSVTGKPTFCSGASTTLTAGVTGGTAPYSYQWKQSTTNTGTSINSYIVVAGGTYTVDVSDSKGCKITSAVVSVTQVAAPAVPVITANTATIVAGGSTVLQATVGTGLQMQWLMNGTPIAGAMQTTYTATQAGSYAIRVTNGDGCTTTTPPYYIGLLTALDELPTGGDFSISASPNPNSGPIKIQLKNQKGNPLSITLLVSDLSGRNLYQKQFRLSGLLSEQVDLSHYQAGHYILTATTDEQQTQLRLIKQ